LKAQEAYVSTRKEVEIDDEMARLEREEEELLKELENVNKVVSQIRVDQIDL
jgi:valyl-tRNA synthetase